MEPPPVFSLDILSDRALLADVLKGVLCTIFFHRLFTSLRPNSRDVLDLTLPSFDDPHLLSLIDTRTATLLSTLSNSPHTQPTLCVQFFEKRARKASWFTKAEEKVCWEQWYLNITILSPKTESERRECRKKIEGQLAASVMKVIKIAGMRREHVPPITDAEGNPFPYAITVGRGEEGWGGRMGGIF